MTAGYAARGNRIRYLMSAAVGAARPAAMAMAILGVRFPGSAMAASGSALGYKVPARAMSRRGDDPGMRLGLFGLRAGGPELARRRQGIASRLSAHQRRRDDTAIAAPSASRLTASGSRWMSSVVKFESS